ncbi:MAG: diguanylate cyclase [Atopobiaceae bacterium]|nr:diguanylate cyclase [Atopobiaceae bacterium]
MAEELIFTNERCVGCNRCVRICSSFGASVSDSDPKHSSILINSERCIVCGACIDVCAHGARNYLDDTDRLFADLAAGEPITLLVAPSFEAKYPNEFRAAFGTLRRLGARRILPVSFGADICTWAYLKHIERGDVRSPISTSCPVVVSYIEHWAPELMERLMPVKSPLMCLATYCREELHMNEKFAFVGPCIGKTLEVQRYPDLVQYNVTFPKLMERIRALKASEESAYDELEHGLGSYYPAPGGLADNVRWFLGDDTPVRIVSGKQYLYERFESNRRKVFSKNLPYALIDALNCQEGCIEGTARAAEDHEDSGLAYINEIRTRSKSPRETSPWYQGQTPAERLQRLNQLFAGLDVESYRATFIDQSTTCSVSLPTAEEAEEIYRSLRKEDPESRQINCSACGYESCQEMVVAIHNGFNSRYNCVYFEKEEALYLSRMSFGDQLTGVMNRNALERLTHDIFGGNHALGMIVADVNGLKQENDTNGHAAGDLLIVATATALANKFGRECVFRTGGDEFLVVLQDYTKDEIAAGMAQVKEHLLMLGMSASMGMSYTEKYSGEFEVLQRLADAEMYQDKAVYYATTGLERR